MSVYEIPEIFVQKDIVYHYCKLNVAMDYILPEKRLRLSHRKNSNDPIEHIIPVSNYSSGPPDGSRGISEAAAYINNLRRKKYSSAKQLCLCRNKVAKKGVRYQEEEHFGFLKPRMWEQYGENYKGVCLAFSLKALKKSAPHFFNGKVEYSKYKRLLSNQVSIDEYKLSQMNAEQYWSGYSKGMEKIMLRKHVDYKGESEYKFLSFSDNEYDYIDIEKCLVGIIIPGNYKFLDETMRKRLNAYAEDYSTQLLYLKWDVSSISITTKARFDDGLEKIQAILAEKAL